MADIYQLNPHANMTPEEALSYCAMESWDDVIIIGFHEGNDAIALRSSHITREKANFILDHAKQKILGFS